MKKKIIKSGIFLSAFAMLNLSIHATPVYASFDMMNGSMSMTSIDNSMNNVGGMTDFNMDMMMDQGNMSMNNGFDTLGYADTTNFMNHDMDNTLNFFFDNMSGYNDDLNMPQLSLQDPGVQNAFEDGLWSSSFNDHFNNDFNIGVQDILCDDNLNENKENTFGEDATAMPSVNDLEFTEVTNPLDQIENNTMPEMDKNDLNTNSNSSALPESNLSSNDIINDESNKNYIN